VQPPRPRLVPRQHLVGGQARRQNVLATDGLNRMARL
jgi:hypothetical protein